jgi:hypothetical protein
MADTTALDIESLCQELPLSWTPADFAELRSELQPFTDAIMRHYARGATVASHVPGSSSLCVPITDVTDPHELYRTADGSVSQEKYTVEDYEDYWITTHYSTVPVVLLLLKQRQGARPKLDELCQSSARILGAPVGANCYFQWNMPGFWWRLHTDDEYEGVARRLHVAFKTTPENVFAWAAGPDDPREKWVLEKHLQPDKVYLTRTDIYHTTVNGHPSEGRLHLILDVGGS